MVPDLFLTGIRTQTLVSPGSQWSAQQPPGPTFPARWSSEIFESEIFELKL